MVIGGIGSIEGPLVGALVFFLLNKFFSDYGTWYLLGLGAGDRRDDPVQAGPVGLGPAALGLEPVPHATEAGMTNSPPPSPSGPPTEARARWRCARQARPAHRARLRDPGIQVRHAGVKVVLAGPTLDAAAQVP